MCLRLLHPWITWDIFKPESRSSPLWTPPSALAPPLSAPKHSWCGMRTSWIRPSTQESWPRVPATVEKHIRDIWKFPDPAIPKMLAEFLRLHRCWKTPGLITEKEKNWVERGMNLYIGQRDQNIWKGQLSRPHPPSHLTIYLSLSAPKLWWWIHFTI